MPNENKKSKPIRCLIDVMGGTRDELGILENRIPARFFGEGPNRFKRKLVLLAIAVNANADTTDAHPSLDVIAERALMSRRTAERHVQWLIEHGLLEKKSKAVPVPGKKTHTNRYRIKFPDLDQDFEHHVEEESEELDNTTPESGVLTEVSNTTPSSGDSIKEQHVKVDRSTGQSKVIKTPKLTGQDVNTERSTCQSEASTRQSELSYERPLERPLERPSLERPKGTTSNNNDTTATPVFAIRTGGVSDATVAASSAFPTPKPASREEPVSEQELMAEITGVFEEAEAPLRTNAKHRQEAVGVATKWGIQVFLGGLELWLNRPKTVEELRIGKTEECGTIPMKSWILNEFLHSGSGFQALNRAKVYSGKMRGQALLFLVEHSVPPEAVSDSFCDAIRWLAEHDLLFALRRAHAVAFEKSGESWGVFTAHLPQHFREYASKDGFYQRKPFDENVWCDYTPIAERLLASEPVLADV